MIKLILKIIVILFVIYLLFLGLSSSRTEKKIENITEDRKTEEIIRGNNENSIKTDFEVPNSVQIANPASVNCIEKGGELEIRRVSLGEYGVCVFDDNRQCEEWAMFRGDCPVGGVKITGYVTDAERFCAIRGGDVNMEEGTCAVDGKVCDLENYQGGGCE